ncbi:MAG: hypothetical protein P0Y60_05795 [Candidatus Microbacterium colombiense]|nr:MAG: hypothetical protein P0Y60_05795 [Microbacterium sp.]
MYRHLRITSASSKVGVLIVAAIAIVMAGIGLSLIDVRLGYLVATALTVATVLFAARTFRGPSESHLSRPWWRMTATPAGGYTLGVLLLLQAAGTAFGLVSGTAPTVAWVGVTIGAIIAAGYLHSARRLSVSSAAPRS